MPNFLQKALRKLDSIVDLHVPYNINYRPSGYHPTLQDYLSSSGAEAVEVYPSEISKLDVPENLCKSNKYQIPVQQVGVQPPAMVIAVKSGRICTNAVNYAAIVAEDNKLIGDISLQVGSTNPADNLVFKQKWFTTPMYLKGSAFHTLIGGSGDSNYFHWMIDSLPRLHLLKKAGWFDKVDWFVVPRSSLSYQKDTLRILGIDTTKTVEGHQIKHIQADKLYTSTFVRNIEHIPAWVCSFLRDSFLPVAQRTAITPKRIYISRQDSNYRNVENEKAVVDLLQKYGFEKVLLSELAFTEQVTLFKNAEYIVSPHGAGLTNIVFCQPGTQVIEIFAKEYTPSLYADLASKVSLSYSHITSFSYPVARNQRAAMHKSINVPLDKLEETIQKAITEKKQVQYDLEQEVI